jgi:hypothetical protein
MIMGVDVSPMWFVVLGVIIAIAVAYRHGRLAGFVAKVKADEAKLVAGAAARLEKFDASKVTNGQGGPATEWSVLKGEAQKFGDEIKGWLPGHAPRPSFEDRLTRLRDVLDEALKKKPADKPAA